MEQKLYRSRDDRVLFGVAGGLGKYFNIDSTIIRIILVILAIWGGIGILFYLIAALVIPEEPIVKTAVNKVEDAVETPRKRSKKEETEEGESEREVISQDYREKDRAAGSSYSEFRGEKIAGIIVLGLGLLFLLEQFIPNFSFGRLWPLILIFIGIMILAGAARRRE